MRLKKNTNPKKLQIREIWKLHQFLKSGLAQKSQTYMIDEIIVIMSNITEDDFLDALSVMYGWGYDKSNPAKLAVMFSAGLKKNNFFCLS